MSQILRNLCPTLALISNIKSPDRSVCTHKRCQETLPLEKATCPGSAVRQHYARGRSQDVSLKRINTGDNTPLPSLLPLPFVTLRGVSSVAFIKTSQPAFKMTLYASSIDHCYSSVQTNKIHPPNKVKNETRLYRENATVIEKTCGKDNILEGVCRFSRG